MASQGKKGPKGTAAFSLPSSWNDVEATPIHINDDCLHVEKAIYFNHWVFAGHDCLCHGRIPNVWRLKL
eukprot:scaffold179233_cov16-Prasinocladus_malaysianus.AAC.1